MGRRQAQFSFSWHACSRACTAPSYSGIPSRRVQSGCLRTSTRNDEDGMSIQHANVCEERGKWIVFWKSEYAACRNAVHQGQADWSARCLAMESGVIGQRCAYRGTRRCLSRSQRRARTRRLSRWQDKYVANTLARQSQRRNSL